jgi:hypothetical protein
MNPMPHHANNTMEVAKETLAMSEKSGDRSMKIMGMVLLAMTGLATMLHAGHAIYRDLFAGSGNKVQKGGEPAPSKAAHQFLGRSAEEGAGERSAAGTEGSWVRKARLTERTPTGEHARPAYRDRHGHAHQR